MAPCSLRRMGLDGAFATTAHATGRLTSIDRSIVAIIYFEANVSSGLLPLHLDDCWQPHSLRPNVSNLNHLYSSIASTIFKFEFHFMFIIIIIVKTGLTLPIRKHSP